MPTLREALERSRDARSEVENLMADRIGRVETTLQELADLQDVTDVQEVRRIRSAARRAVASLPPS